MSKNIETFVFNLKAKADVSDAQNKLKSLFKTAETSFNGMGNSKTNGMLNSLQQAQNLSAKITERMNKGLNTSGEAKDLINDVKTFQKLTDEIQQTLRAMAVNPEDFFSSKVADNVQKADNAVQQLKKDVKSLSSLSENIKTRESGNEQLEKDLARFQSGNFVGIESFKIPISIDNKQLNAQVKAAQAELKSALKTDDTTRIDTAKIQWVKTLGQVSEWSAQKVRDEKKAFDELNNTNLNNLRNSAKALFDEIKKNNPDLVDIDYFKNFNIPNATKQSIANFIDKLKEVAPAAQTAELDKLGKKAAKLSEGFAESATQMEVAGREGSKAYESLSDTERAERSLKTLTNRIEYFFSLQSGFRLMTRVIRDAFNTVKELDAAMTETAVVTDNTVGDMWNQLATYTQKANELGATTLGAYQTMTLYYQQGLKDQAAWDLGVETMKMARIANMDYTTATNAMTAAVRGFNLELNAASGQRVNDVYSKLAAITASDTKEISTAMEKTASLAHNAGMDLETTAVYLSQALETTREAPENIGTAMKTILARFQSLTKDPDTLTQDVQDALEGETVDANAIEAALRKAGVALRDEAGQFRDAKDVMLELNATWDSLDKNTQRYIATQTAGSRQQSRFIAMMQDYTRTQELLGAANNSTGASQEQFNKTLESLDSKLNRFKNAWNEFVMGLSNNKIIKQTVDLLTDLLTVINKLTGQSGSIIGFFTKWALAISAFKGAGKIFGAFSKMMGGNFELPEISVSGIAGIGGKIAKELKKVNFDNAGTTLKTKLEHSLAKKLNNIRINTKIGLGKTQLEDNSTEGYINKLKKRLNELKQAQNSTLQNFDDDSQAQEAVMYAEAESAAIKEKIVALNAEAAARGIDTGAILAQNNALIAEDKIRIAAINALIAEGTLTAEEEAILAAELATRSANIKVREAENGIILASNATKEAEAVSLKAVVAGLLEDTAAKVGDIAVTLGLATAEEVAAASTWQLLGPLAAVAAVLLAGVAIWKLYTKGIEDSCQRAQDSIKNYNDTVKSVNENLATIGEVKDEFNSLAEGVNNAGQNVGLSTEQFQRYHEIVNQLAEISPSIVKGYDAEGNAIVNKTTAIQGLIQAEQEELELAKQQYTSTSNLEDIIVDVKEKNKDLSATYQNGKINSTGALKMEESYYTKRLELLQQIEEQEKTNAKLGNADKGSGEKKLANLQSQLDELNNVHSIALEAKTNYQEITDVLNTYMSTLDGAQYFQANFNNLISAGIEDIATSGKSAAQMKAEVNTLLNTLKKSPKVLKKYQKAQREVTKAKKEFDKSAKDDKAVKRYNKSVNSSYTSMINMAKKYEASSSKSLQAVGKALRSAAEGMKSYASNSSKSLTDALNPFQAMIAAAEEVGKAIDDIKDHDYYSAADSINEMLSTATDEINAAGKGSKTYWTAASAVLSENAMRAVGYNKEAIDKMMAAAKSYTESGETGAINFAQALADKGLLDDAGNLHFDTSNIDDIAADFGLTTDAFIANLNKAAQYIDIDWADSFQQVLNAAKNYEGTYTSQTKTVGKDSKMGIWMDDLHEQVIAAGADWEVVSKQWIESGHIMLGAAIEQGKITEITGKKLAKQFAELDSSFVNKNGTYNGKAMVAAMVDQGRSEEQITKTIQQMQKEGVKFGKGFNLEDAIDQATIAKAVADDPTSNVIKSDVCTRLDKMLAIMGAYDASIDKEYKKERKKNNNRLDEIDKATKNGNALDSSNETYKAVKEYKNKLKSENDMLQAAIDSGNLSNKKQNEYQKRIDANNKQLENINAALKENANATRYSAVQKIAQDKKLDSNSSDKEIKKAFKDTDFENDSIQALRNQIEATNKGLEKSVERIHDIDGALKDLDGTSRNVMYDAIQSLETGNLDEYIKKINSLKPEVRQQIYAEFPEYKTLADYSGQIDKLSDKKKQVVIDTVLSGDFNSDEWEKFTKTNPKIAVQIETQAKLWDKYQSQINELTTDEQQVIIDTIMTGDTEADEWMKFVAEHPELKNTIISEVQESTKKAKESKKDKSTSAEEETSTTNKKNNNDKKESEATRNERNNFINNKDKYYKNATSKAQDSNTKTSNKWFSDLNKKYNKQSKKSDSTVSGKVDKSQKITAFDFGNNKNKEDFNKTYNKQIQKAKKSFEKALTLDQSKGAESGKLFDWTTVWKNIKTAIGNKIKNALKLDQSKGAESGDSINFSELWEAFKEKLREKVRKALKIDQSKESESGDTINLKEIFTKIKTAIKDWFNKLLEYIKKQLSEGTLDFLHLGKGTEGGSKAEESGSGKQTTKTETKKSTKTQSSTKSQTSNKSTSAKTGSTKSSNTKDIKQKITLESNSKEIQKELTDVKSSVSKIPKNTKTKIESNAKSEQANINELKKRINDVPSTKKTNFNNNAENAKQKVNDVKSAINKVPSVKDITLNVKKNLAGLGSKLRQLFGLAKGKNITSAGIGQNLGSMAFGSALKGSKRGKLGPNGHGGATLTGELGPELVWEPNNSNAYITGAYGPEIRDLPGNAVVWPADQTKRILMNSAAKGKNFGSMGTANFSALLKKASSGSGGSSSGTSSSSNKKTTDKTEKWENTYDKWYNAAKKVDKLLRKADKLQQLYEYYLNNEIGTGVQAAQAYKDLLKTYQDTIDESQSIMTAIEQQAAAFDNGNLTYYINGSEDNGKGSVRAANYAWWDEAEKRVVINWDAINGITDTGLGDAVNTYISKLEDYQSQWEDYEDKVLENTLNMENLIADARDAAVDAINSISSVIEEERQSQIDALSKVNDNISSSTSKLMDSITKSIDKLRTQRDNENTEKDLANKRAQLALLKMDTSGANAVRIKELEKELADAEQSYTDSLVDQKLDAIQESMDTATTQRQDMIDLLQQQLDWDRNSGMLSKEAQAKLSQYTDTQGNLTEKGLEYLRSTSKEWQQAGALERINLENAWKTDAKNAFVYNQTANTNNLADKNKDSTLTDIKNSNGAKGVYIDGKEVSVNDVRTGDKYGTGSIIYDNKYYSSYIDSEGNLVASSVGKDVDASDKITKTSTSTSNNPSVQTNTNNTSQSQSSANTSTPSTPVETYPYGKASTTTGNIGYGAKGAQVKAIQYALNQIMGAGLAVDGKFGPKTKAAVRNFQRTNKITADGIVGKNTRAKFKLKGYSEGGLADFTGPAWLDGTPTKPELVLNPKDSANFIQLKDILSSVLSNSSDVQSSTANYYINIDVDSIANDYDVEKLAEKLKKEITKDSNYRNVNTIRRLK